MKSALLRVFVPLAAFSALAAQPPPATPPPAPVLPPVDLALKPTVKKEESKQWVFSLLSKSLQKNPNLELTVITEMTDEGKKLPPVTPEHPAYYVLQSSGHHQMGDSTGGDKGLPQADVERILTRSLAANGFHPAQAPAQPPTLAIFYIWGSHNLLVEGDPDNPTLSAQQVARNLLDRAALVGGEKFAKQMLDLFQQADAFADGTYTPPPTASGAATPGQAVFTPEQTEMLNPVYQFKLKNPKNEFLVDQAADDIYYVVASVYDYKSLAEKRRRLLWRTRMTVSAKGVSEDLSLPTLIATAAPYFGREMDEADTLVKRTVPEGKVDIGTPTVVPPPGANANAAAPAKP